MKIFFLSKQLRIWRYNTLFYLLIELFMLNFEIPLLSFVGRKIYDRFENRLSLNLELICTFFLEKKTRLDRQTVFSRERAQPLRSFMIGLFCGIIPKIP